MSRESTQHPAAAEDRSWDPSNPESMLAYIATRSYRALEKPEQVLLLSDIKALALDQKVAFIRKINIPFTDVANVVTTELTVAITHLLESWEFTDELEKDFANIFLISIFNHDHKFSMHIDIEGEVRTNYSQYVQGVMASASPDLLFYLITRNIIINDLAILAFAHPFFKHKDVLIPRVILFCEGQDASKKNTVIKSCLHVLSALKPEPKREILLVSVKMTYELFFAAEQLSKLRRVMISAVEKLSNPVMYGEDCAI